LSRACGKNPGLAGFTEGQAEKRRIWLSGNRRQRFADGFGVLAKLFRVAIDLPRRSADVSAKASFRTS